MNPIARVNAAISDQINAFLTASCISRSQLDSLIEQVAANHDQVRLLRATAGILYDGDDRHAAPPQGLTLLADMLQDGFGFELNEDTIPRPGRRALTVFAQLIGVVLCGSTLFVVLGGIAAGESALTSSFGVPVGVTYGILLLALMLLGSLEGTQIAIVALTDKKVAAFGDRYPRGCQAIKRVQTRSMVQRYLAGRQFFVIFVVFVIAQVTSFPSMQMLPFTSLSLDSLPELVIFLGFRLGLFGALLVLWLAQLLPQFIANKNPLFFLNLHGMSFVIRICLVFEAIGPTKPANWLSSIFREELRVSTSRFAKHTDLVDDVFGYDVVNQSHVWQLQTLNRWSFQFTNAFGIHTEGIDQLTEKSLHLFGNVSAARFENTLLRSGVPDELTGTMGAEASHKGRGWTKFEQVVSGEGAFNVGDVVRSAYHFQGHGIADRTHISISKPTRLVSVRIRLEDRTIADPTLIINKFHYDDLTEKSTLIFRREVPFCVGEEAGVRTAGFIDVHPRLNIFYELQWTHPHAEHAAKPTETVCIGDPKSIHAERPAALVQPS